MIPSHTCYVEIFFSGCWRIFEKPLSPVEVMNDYERPHVIDMQRLLKHSPDRLFAALCDLPVPTVRDPQIQWAAHCFRGLLQQWEIRESGPLVDWRPPQTMEEMLERFRKPYQRMRTVNCEALPWRECIDHYNDERAVHIIEPPWPPHERDLYVALSLRLRRARCRWVLKMPAVPTLTPLFLPLGKASFVEPSDRGENDSLLIASFVPVSVAASSTDTGTKQREQTLSLWEAEQESA